VNGPVLTLLAVIIAALLVLGALGTALRRRAREAIGFGGAGIGGLGAILALLALLLDESPVELILPAGLPGAAFRLALDPLSGFFALLLFVAGTAAIVFAAEADPADSPSSLAGMPVCLAGLALAVLAADGFALGTGLALSGGAIWAMGRTDDPARTGPAVLGVSLLAAASAIAAVAVLARPGGELGFVAIRAAAAQAPPAPAALLTAVLGLTALAGLAPLHLWLVPAHRAAPPRAAALLSGTMVPIAFYALIRLLFDLPAAALPLWCGLPPLLFGAASVMLGGFAAARQDTLDAALAAGTVRLSGLLAIGLGIALTARAQDLPDVTALALGAVLLGAAAQALCGTLVTLAAGAIRRGAATRRLSRLGGLIHRMPVTTACLLAGLFGLAALPPGAGFATLWLLFQALLAALQTGSPGLQAQFVGLGWVLGLGTALAAASLVRLIGVACLGRPRTPRAAVAEPLPRPARVPLLLLAGASAMLGVFAGPVLRLLAEPAIREMIGTGLGSRAGLLRLSPAPGAPGYATLPLAILLALAGGGVVLWLRRHRQPAGARSGPAWDDGFAAPPAWLPFGDPLTQSSGAGFTPLPDDLPPLWPQMRWRALRHHPAWLPIGGPAVVLSVLAALLAMLRWLPPS